MAFFASPAKPWLIRQLNKRNGSTPATAKRPSPESTATAEQYLDARMGFGGATQGPGGPGSGVPNDALSDIQDAVEEIKTEVEARRRRGSVVKMPTGTDMKRAVEEKIGYKLP